jgi:hypothetical protein
LARSRRGRQVGCANTVDRSHGCIEWQLEELATTNAHLCELLMRALLDAVTVKNVQSIGDLERPRHSSGLR